ncbi:MAG TPA: hypothetical protein VHG10_09520 [Glycomyces sp.]|nr:hypothetical protein [Glycomyces sp.]
MTGNWTMPPATAMPPGAGFAPPAPMTGTEYPTEEDNLVREHGWALQDAEADQHKSTADLRKDAERTREQVNDSVLELRERLGLDPDAAHARGAFAPVRRHPYTVAVAAAGAATAAVVGVRLARGHRKTAKQAAREAAEDAIKAAERRRKASRKAARKRWAEAKRLFDSAASTLRKKRKKAMRRLSHH